MYTSILQMQYACGNFTGIQFQILSQFLGLKTNIPDHFPDIFPQPWQTCELVSYNGPDLFSKLFLSANL